MDVDEEGDEADEDVKMDGGEEGENAGSPKRKGKGKRRRKSELNMEVLANEAAAVAALQGDQLQQVRLKRKYYAEGLSFIRQVEVGMKLIEQLLASTSKAEVLEAMEFFRIVHILEFEGAEVCTNYRRVILFALTTCVLVGPQEDASPHLVEGQLINVRGREGVERHPTPAVRVLP